MRQILLSILIVSIISCGSGSAESYLIEAQKMEEQGNYKEAIKILDKAIEKDRKFIEAYLNRGAYKSATGDFEGAIIDYIKVLEIDPKNTLALVNIGNNYKRLKKFDKAVEYYNQAFETKGGQQFYVDYLPNDIMDMSKFDVPGHEIHYERGIAYYYTDSLQKSYNDFNLALQKNYMEAECYYWLGIIFLTTEEMDDACENLKKSVELGDRDAEQMMLKYCN